MSSCNENWKKYLLQDTSESDDSLTNTTPGVNFTEVLCTAFTLVDPKSVKNYT